jgi:hypothetical protein
MTDEPEKIGIIRGIGQELPAESERNDNPYRTRCEPNISRVRMKRVITTPNRMILCHRLDYENIEFET